MNAQLSQHRLKDNASPFGLGERPQSVDTCTCSDRKRNDYSARLDPNRRSTHARD